MDSASLQFVLFGLIAAALSNLSRSRVWRSIVIMLASLIFLAMLAKSAFVLIPLAAFLLFGYGASPCGSAAGPEARPGAFRQ